MVRTRTLLAGKRVFGPNTDTDFIYHVTDGHVGIFACLPDGRLVGVGIVGPSDVFGVDYAPSHRPSEARALTEATIEEMDREEFDRRLVAEHAFRTSVVASQAQRIAALQTFVELLLVRDVSLRLMALLLDLSSRAGKEHSDGKTLIEMRLRHDDLGAFIGANRVTITRAMIELADAGLIEYPGRNAIAVDRHGLEERYRRARERG